MESGRALLLAGRLLIQATFLVMVISMQFHGTSYAKANSHHLCSSSCGSIRYITSPFRLTTDPLSCRDLSSKQYYSYYYVFDDAFESDELDESCWIEQTSFITKGHSNKKLTSNDIHNLLVYGFELSWMQSFATRHQSSCYVDGEDSNSVHCINYCIFPDYRVDDMDRPLLHNFGLPQA
ncbi:hypothetical protein TIFTF001_020835 [Ficus carica]|uniref:Wall-associated receptor kinase galacturonan-binding domain-containing protein n=1 Tax=Ficus carica TaxID=3494 RepID=A0AA88DD09_FICCA|nr:hypothetical protein TIFTF001_020835 [Ficus carica]